MPWRLRPVVLVGAIGLAAMVGCAVVAWWNWPSEEQAAAELRQLGASVTYAPQDPGWLVALLGHPRRERVSEVIVGRVPEPVERLRLLGNLPQLKVLSFGGSSLNDQQFVALPRIGGLLWLDLSSAQVGDASMSRVAEMSSLEWLSLAYTDITNDGLSTLISLEELETLNVEGTSIGDKLPRLPQSIAILTLADTSLTDDDMPSLADLAALERLNISGTQVSDRGLRQLANLHSLRNVIAVGTKMTPEGAERFMKDRPEVIVDLEKPKPSTASTKGVGVPPIFIGPSSGPGTDAEAK